MNNNKIQTSETGQTGLTDSQKLDLLIDRVTKVEKGVKKINRYFFWTGIITLVTFVIPLIIAIIALPWMMSTLSSSVGGALGGAGGGDVSGLLDLLN